MNTIEIVLIIALVVGVIGSNFALIKYANKFKLPPNVKQHFEQDEQQQDQPTPDKTKNADQTSQSDQQN